MDAAGFWYFASGVGKSRPIVQCCCAVLGFYGLFKYVGMIKALSAYFGSYFRRLPQH